jgi:Clp protease
VSVIAASMASVIFALGTERTVANGSRTMIHRPWIGNISGEATDLRKSADLLDSLEKDLVTVYVKATGLPEDRITQLMSDETWFSADEAVAIGLATNAFGKISSAIPVEYLAKFEHVPADLLEEKQLEAEAVVPNTMAGLRASVRTLTTELHARTKERDDARAALARTKFLLSALERSYGLAATQTAVPTPIGAGGETPDPLETLNSLEGATQSEFYRANKEAIWRSHQNRRQLRQ